MENENQYKRIEGIDEIINDVLENLSKNLKENEIFLSEADFQFSFAIC